MPASKSSSPPTWPSMRRRGEDSGRPLAEDSLIFEYAFRERRVIVSADTDFGTLLALREAPLPSVILFRGATPSKPDLQTQLLLANLDEIATMLERGAIVVIEPQRMRVRMLPISGPKDSTCGDRT